MSNIHFYRCDSCGIIAVAFGEHPLPQLKELVPNTVDASGEKHLPVVKVEGNTVTVNVGSIDHPMTEEHLIEWVHLVTDKGAQRKFLNPEDKPVVTFELSGEKPLEVYAWCNLHGLWMTEVK